MCACSFCPATTEDELARALPEAYGVMMEPSRPRSDSATIHVVAGPPNPAPRPRNARRRRAALFGV